MSQAPAEAEAAKKGMVWIPGGMFAMGSERHYPEEAPVREVTVGGFWMDEHPVTNLEFLRFVKATGHVTSAEQAPDPAQYPGRSPTCSSPGRSPSRGPPGRST
jgi:formylglycine-generating enzyme required for sulfatase activity